MKKIRVGVIGLGHWSEYGHLPSLNLLPEYELTAVYSRSAQKAAALVERHGFRYAAASLEELVSHPEVDLVLVLTPAFQHEEGIRAAIAAGKDVYCEWPLTPSTALSKELLALAEKAGVRTIVGLQRRLNPGYCYLRDLLARGEIGEVRSVRLHVSVEYFQRERPASLYYTVPEENFSSLLSIYGGHFLDALFNTIVGFPESLSALTVNQFKEVTLIETGETLPHSSADQVVLAGTFANGAVLSVHLEAGKRNNHGVQLDITGSKGDLKLWNTTSFGDAPNRIEIARGDGQPLAPLDVPTDYDWLPPSDLGASVRELANLYAAHARDVREGTASAPTFADAIRMHELIGQIVESDRSGTRVALPARS
ncbi:Gfo/Idh/MocA family protein [Caballeronia humi]|uniref:Oxidoreductase domain-containing protein n=1 Tax=Caballeronia humi TaxID=326474 RepID=A0A158GR21_9BURK|nr:Gfo/Idh/MocA family oxidoreductase [Caballeronia humi]SAL34515.1 oxidoreductase domain-containing protein [Caballeronia humi]